MEEWQKPETITLWIVIIGSFLILLLGFIMLLVRTIFKKIVRTKMAESKAQLEHQEKLLDTTIKTQEIERKRIAADLHDALIGKLTVLKLKNQMNYQEKDSVYLIDDCIATARRISHDLSPPLLEYTPLSELLQEILQPWENSLQIVCRYDIRTNYNHTDDFKIQLTRIIQELITNVSKHAKATQISVHFRQSQKGQTLLLKDNGQGFDMDKYAKGLGLNNIETRVKYLQGTYHMKSIIGKGTSALFLFKSSNNNLL